MDRSRSKRYYYDHQDYDSENPPPRMTKQRYNNNNNNSHGGAGGHHYGPNNHRRSFSGGGGGGRKMQDPSLMVTTSYRILCHDVKAGGVIGKSGSIIKTIRQHTGAWINVHELIPGDEERIIEISDTRRRDPDGRMPAFSPAQEALFLIHDRILESETGGNNGGGGGYNAGFGGGGGMDEEDDYGMRGGGGGNNINNPNRVVTRLVVSRMHVGCLLGKGGKIIEQMRMETKTHIRVLPRDHTLPRCVAMSEEIVQVTGDVSAVKNAITIISSRLRESQHRDRSNFNGKLHSPDRFFPDEELIPHGHTNNPTRRDGGAFGSRFSASSRNNSYTSRQSGFAIEPDDAPATGNARLFPGQDLVFRMLCPIDKVETVIGESDGIIELLQNEIGVDVKVADPVAGSEEQIVIISSDEGPDDELFPAQEALLHIQTRIVDLVPEKENIITTRLLLQSDEIGCLESKDGSLSDMRKLSGANLQIVPREELPVCVSDTEEILQIVGEIKAARVALVEVTSKLRSYIYRDFFQKDTFPPPASASISMEGGFGLEVTPGRVTSSSQDTNDSPTSSSQSAPMVTTQPVKDAMASSSQVMKPVESERREEVVSGLSRITIPLVTRSTLEVVIPPHAAPKLVTKSRNKLAQISELSGASVKLMEDNPEVTEKVIQISGTPEQAERAQSLLQGFILSTQEDDP